MSSTFVGRTEELETLMERFDRALAGEGYAVFLTGEAGAGKSTLTQRFLTEVTLREPEVRIVTTGCSEQYGAGEPYQPFVDAFRDLVSAGGDKGAKGKKSLRQLAKEVAPYWVAAIPVAGELISATMATAVELKESFGGGTATAAPPSEEALFFQFTELFIAAAEQHPLVFFIDDLHWADRATVSLLGHLTRKIEDKPVLILGTYRAADVEVEKHPLKQMEKELKRYKVAETMALEPLGNDALAELVEQELGGPPTPELLHLLTRRAGSNPLFFTELLKWLVEGGHAGERAGEWGLDGSPEEIEIPRSAEAVIEKRLDRLDQDDRRILEYASVEGDEFNSVVLARLLDVDELELEESLEPLVRTHKLIALAETRDLPDGDIASIYVFNHTLTQDVLHRGLQGKRRILLHRKVAEILEEIHGGDDETVAHKLALHYDEGRKAERAWECAVRAADRAGRVYAFFDAIELLELGLRNAESEDHRLEVLERLGEANRQVGHYAEALDFYGQALEAANAEGEEVRALGIRNKVVLAERDYGSRSPDELLAELDDLAEQAREKEAATELCEILWSLGSIPGAPISAAQEALEIANRLGDPQRVGRAHYVLGRLLMFSAPEEARPHLNDALARAEKGEHKVRMGLCHNCLAVIHVFKGEYREAVDEFASAASLFDEVGDPVNEASVRNNLGQLLVRMGAWDGAEANLEEAIRLARRMDVTARLLHPLENMGHLFQEKGELDKAEEYWTELLQLAEETGYWDTEIVARCGLGMAALEAGDTKTARERLEAAREKAPDEEWTESEEVLKMLEARVLAAEGELDAALEVLEAAEKELKGRERYLWAVYRCYRGELLGPRDAETARALVMEAHEVFEQLGAEAMNEKAAAILEQLGER